MFRVKYYTSQTCYYILIAGKLQIYLFHRLNPTYSKRMFLTQKSMAGQDWEAPAPE